MGRERVELQEAEIGCLRSREVFKLICWKKLLSLVELVFPVILGALPLLGFFLMTSSFIFFISCV